MISTVSNPSLPCSQIPRNGNAVAIRPPNPVELIQSPTLGSRIIPKIGAIVKRFSLNYSGEGLVTDPNRVRTVRVGIRFQVQVDSFLNNNAQTTLRSPTGSLPVRPRGIPRTNSAPHFINSNCDSYSTPTITDITPSNRQFAIEGGEGRSPTLHRNFTSAGNLSKESTCYQSDIELDSSSGVSSLGGRYSMFFF